jgi:hypothetical protein
MSPAVYISIKKWVSRVELTTGCSVGATQPAGEPCVGGWENFSIVSVLLPTDNLAQLGLVFILLMTSS